jgi:hypothetical protein
VKRPEHHGLSVRRERFRHEIERLERLAEIEMRVGHVGS